MTKNVMPLFNWASENGEVKAVDRILVKVMLDMIKHKVTITTSTIERMDRLEVPEEFFEKIKSSAENIVGRPFMNVQYVPGE